jgi:ribosomal protein S18 acetylase RimI-like enzyme
MLIRDYDDELDRNNIRVCLIELQEFERRIDPRMPPGEEIADAYFSEMKQNCCEYLGKIMVAYDNREIAGYVTLLTKVRSDDIDDGNLEHGLITDLVVRKMYRGHGFGRSLISAAETFAKANNVRWLRLSVLARNTVARNLYTSFGFSELYVEYEKDLNDHSISGV